jgi:hypothetical protein
MGRYIHAKEYKNAVIYKYWFGKQSSELGEIILPFGAKVIEYADYVNAFDEFSVGKNVYQAMRKNVSKLRKLLDPEVRDPKALDQFLIKILDRKPRKIEWGHSMREEADYQEACSYLEQPIPAAIAARLDLILTLITFRPIGQLSSEAPA